MSEGVAHWDLVQALDAEGFPLPANCRKATVRIAYDSVILIDFEVLPTREDLVKLGRALARLDVAKEL